MISPLLPLLVLLTGKVCPIITTTIAVANIHLEACKHQHQQQPGKHLMSLKVREKQSYYISITVLIASLNCISVFFLKLKKDVNVRLTAPSRGRLLLSQERERASEGKGKVLHEKESSRMKQAWLTNSVQVNGRNRVCSRSSCEEKLREKKSQFRAGNEESRLEGHLAWFYLLFWSPFLFCPQASSLEWQ